MNKAERLDLKIEVPLARFNEAMRLYVKASGKSAKDVLLKKGSQLGYALWKLFRALRPVKGSIREARMAALKRGEGLRIRRAAIEFAMNKTLATASDLKTRAGVSRMEKTKKGGVKSNGRTWWQIAAQREIAIRESGIGFMAQGVKFRFAQVGQQGRGGIEDHGKAYSRYSPTLGAYQFKAEEHEGKVVFHWGGFSKMSNEVVKAMTRAKGWSAIRQALDEVVKDTIPYLQKKLGVDAARHLTNK